MSLLRRGANVPMLSTGASTGGVCVRCASRTARTHLTRRGLGRLRRPRPRAKMAMRVIAMEQDATTQPKLWVYLRRAELVRRGGGAMVQKPGFSPVKVQQRPDKTLVSFTPSCTKYNGREDWAFTNQVSDRILVCIPKHLCNLT